MNEREKSRSTIKYRQKMEVLDLYGSRLFAVALLKNKVTKLLAPQVESSQPTTIF